MPLTFDYIMSNDDFTNFVNRYIFETLIKLEDNILVSKHLEYWQSQDERHLIFKIKEESRFSDGYHLSAKDVMHSFQRAITHPSSIYFHRISLDSMVVEDKNIVHLYHQNNDDIIDFLTSVPIYKASYLTNFDDHFLQYNPLSLGEYYLYSQSSEEIILKKNKFYQRYLNLENSKNPDQIVLIYDPSLENHYRLFKQGKIDFLPQIPYSSYREIVSNNHYSVLIHDSNRIIYLMLNTNPQVLINGKIAPNPLSQKMVRQALIYILDTSFFIQNQLMGYANILVIPAMYNGKYYPYEKMYYPFDPQTSQQLMLEAGYAEGFEMQLYVKESAYGTTLSQYISAKLQELNIKTSVYFYDDFDQELTWENNVIAAQLSDFPICADNCLKEPIYDLYYHQSAKIGSLNIFHNQHPRINALLDSLAVMNENNRFYTSTSQALADLVYDELYVIPLFNPHDIYIYHKKNPFKNSGRFSFNDFMVGL